MCKADGYRISEPSLPDTDDTGAADRGPAGRAVSWTGGPLGVSGRLPSGSQPAGPRGVSDMSEAQSGEEAQQLHELQRRGTKKATGGRWPPVCLYYLYRLGEERVKRRRHSSAEGEQVELSPRRSATPVDLVCMPKRQRALPAHSPDYDLSCDNDKPIRHYEKHRLACLHSVALDI